MNHIIGLLTANNELAEDLRNNLTGLQVMAYRSVESLRVDEYELLIIDIDTLEPPESVQFYLSRIRKKIQDIAVILILRVSNIDDIRTDWFIDDFVLYPFRKNEVMARIRRLLWKTEVTDDVILIGNLRINLNEYSVYLNNQKLDLTYKEFELLRLFVQNRGTVFTRKELLSKIWGMEYIGGTRTVDVHIRRLRGKLGEGFDSIIETVRNVGYRCRE